MVVTQTDLDILKAIMEARYLTKDLIWKLIWGAQPSKESWCKTKLRNMYDNELLDKRVTYQGCKDTYYLGRVGRKLLSQTGIDPEWLKKIAGVPGQGIMPTQFLEHELTLSRLYVEAKVECSSRGWTMEWKNTRMLELEGLHMEPDAHIAVSGMGKIEAYLEFTHQITGRHVIISKLNAYTGKSVLWFTNSEAKVKTLQNCGVYAVTTVQPNWLTAPIWNIGDTKNSWIRPRTNRVNLK